MFEWQGSHTSLHAGYSQQISDGGGLAEAVTMQQGDAEIHLTSNTSAIVTAQFAELDPIFQEMGNIALYFVVLFAVISAFGYFQTFWTKIDDRFKARERRRLILLQKRQRRHVSTRDVPTN